MDQALRDTIAQRFPGALVYINDPEVAAVLEEAVAEEWTAETFDANLRATSWYMKKTDAQRIAYGIEHGNPGEAAARVNALKEKIHTLAYALGSDMDDGQLGAYAWQAFREGWSEQDLRYNIATVLQPAGTSMGAASIRQLAKQYMVTLTDDKVTDLTRRAFAGMIDEQGLRGMFAAQASSQFPSLAELINGGTTPSDYFDPYRQLIAKYTDTVPDQVDFNSPTWRKIVSNVAPDGKLRPMTLDEANRYIRSTDEFANSATGQQELANFQIQIEEMLGARR